MKSNQKILITTVLIIAGFLITILFRYWYGDILYAKGKALNANKDFSQAKEALSRAISYNPGEILYHLELAQSLASLKDETATVSEIEKIENSFPENINTLRTLFTIYIKLSVRNKTYLENAVETVGKAITLSPTDAKLYYDLGLTYVRRGENDKAIGLIRKAAELKPNYKEARLALAYILIDAKKIPEAKIELNYILEKIDPKDDRARQTLEEIK